MSERQVIVTGASRGIGASIARELDRRGYAVVGLSRSGESPVGRAMAVNVADEAALATAIAEVAANGPIEGLVNNAGLHESNLLVDLSVEEYERTMRINATAVMIACREVFPHLAKSEDREGGLIVNLGSFFDKVGVARQLAYTASKAAIAAMTRVLAVEWARNGIAVVNVAPGYIETDLAPEFWENEASKQWIRQRVPVRRGGRPEEVARFVGALFTEKIPFLTGETIYLDGAHGINH